MYWIVLAFFSAFETVADIFVFWFPLYYEIKLVFILWLILPQTRGHILVYRYLVHPILARHEEAIDLALEDAGSRARAFSDHVSQQGFKAMQDYAFNRPRSAAPKIKEHQDEDVVLSNNIRNSRPLQGNEGRPLQQFTNVLRDPPMVPKRPDPPSDPKLYMSDADVDRLLRDMKKSDYMER